ncbi:DUF1835 domain-containing protein [Mucilaginibacter glaciei]|uniref:DUF1835 domain-containing protein n=1 Tax=Mucilaginibacter glaciei TaxID=2772109 RepID=A0A926S171_9SPHI|nr:DUF1835 domain-containing protein [Mucilaginibacter glaciei]MBD1393700.1 DUF1835 domain-containing protein [Mucilaginibacter glaciei]
MSKILHVLNGDATLDAFEQTGLDGDVMVWREVLSEGPVSRNVSAACFWERRLEFIKVAFDENEENYRESVLIPLEKLSEPYDEINLWFEYDLHCQVNLLGVMMLLEQQTNLSERAVYLICPVEVPEVEDFAGMGELNADQLEGLYDNARVQLGEYDFTLATEAWDLYVKSDAKSLQSWIDETPFWGNMPQLPIAMQAHLSRLDFDDSGLNGIHRALLKIYKSGITTKADIYREFWRTQKIYGMGDKELDIYINQLVERGLINIAE